MALSISINNRTIPLNRDFSMQLTWRSAICSFDKIPSSYALGLSFPINDYTRAIFGSPERFEKHRIPDDNKFTGCEIRFSGTLLIAGTVTITGVSGDVYNASLDDLVGVIGEKELERELHEIDVFDEELAFTKKTNYDPETDPYCLFPVKNAGFFKDRGKIVKRTITETDPYSGESKEIKDSDIELLSFLFRKQPIDSIINARTITGEIFTTDTTIRLDTNDEFDAEVSVVTPFFFLRYILRKMLKVNDFYIENSIIDENEELKKLCLYNNYDITRMFFTTDRDVSTVRYSSPYVAAGRRISIYNRTYSSMVINTQNHIPNISIGDFLLGLQNFINIFFDFKQNNKVDIRCREAIITGSSFDLNKFSLGKWEPGEKKNLTLKFISEHDSNDVVFSEYNDLSDRRNSMKPAVDTWDDLLLIASPQFGDIRFVKDRKIYAEYKWLTIEYSDKSKNAQYIDAQGWEQISIGFQDGFYQYGNDKTEEIKTPFSTLAGNASLPVCNQTGNMNVWKNTVVDFSSRLLFYRGNNFGGNTTDTLSLDWDSSTGLIEKRWKNWARFWANRLPVTGSFSVPVNLLKYIIDNINQKYRTREGEFLIEEMSCEITIDSIGDLEIKGFKVE